MINVFVHFFPNFILQAKKKGEETKTLSLTDKFENDRMGCFKTPTSWCNVGCRKRNNFLKPLSRIQQGLNQGVVNGKWATQRERWDQRSSLPASDVLTFQITRLHGSKCSNFEMFNVIFKDKRKIGTSTLSSPSKKSRLQEGFVKKSLVWNAHNCLEKKKRKTNEKTGASLMGGGRGFMRRKQIVFPNF